MKMKDPEDKIQEILALLRENAQDQRLLDAVLELLREGKDKPFLLELMKSEEAREALFRLIELSEGAPLEKEKEEVLKEKLNSRAQRSEKDIEAGRTYSLDEVSERMDAFIRRHYEG